MKVYEIPELSKQSRGRLIGNIIKMSEDEKIRDIVIVKDFVKDKEVVL